MTTSFPESHLNSKNSLSLFLASDQTKLKVLDNFKQLNRDLTQAFLNSSDPNKPVKKQPRQRRIMSDKETFNKVSTMFSNMHKPRDGNVQARAMIERSHRESQRFKRDKLKSTGF
jgi:hypothetical protein